ncbi:aladin-like [Asterias rubens]|uniref:aladin-like n=1 Tax=Asterias rubens TaxID=7604 RepID=UPI00145561C5|nr:aladin-like [Asterias rubens]XP_033639314.1 aladin-like [Asterias rubens]
MCTLADGPPPPREGFVTVCEFNSDLHTALAGESDLSKYTPGMQGLVYPKVTLAVETLSSLAIEEDARSAFLPCNAHISIWKKAWYACKEHGTCGMLEELANSKTEASWMVSSIACGCLAAIRWANSLHGSLYPHLVLSSEAMVSVFSPTRDWQDSAIRALAWHPHTNKCAVAWKDDVVRVFTANSEVVPTLKHRFQRVVAFLAWKPLSASVLAVACQTCIMIWNVDPKSLSTRPSASCAQVLSQNGHGPITSLAWDPRGRMLVSASPSDTAMPVWDVPRETCVTLRRSGGGGVSLLRWSPDNTKLFTATPSEMFRVWETRTWTCEKWTGLSGRCQAACWSPDSKTLLFCTENKPIIYALGFNETGDVIGGARAAVTCADLSEVTVDCDQQQISVGGLIQDLAWDPNGERLAVLFKSTESNNLIALFNTRLEPVLELIPSGFVRGEPGDIPQLVSFQPNFQHGSLLTVCWHTGKVSFIPLMYIPTKSLQDNSTSPFNYAGANTPFSQELFTQNEPQ